MFKADGTQEEFLGHRQQAPLISFCLSEFDYILADELNYDRPPVLDDPDWERYTDTDYNNGDIVILTDSNFDKVVYNSPEMWIVVFSAEFCKFCKLFAPIYKEHAAAVNGKIRFGYIDAVN